MILLIVSRARICKLLHTLASDITHRHRSKLWHSLSLVSACMLYDVHLYVRRWVASICLNFCLLTRLSVWHSSMKWMVNGMWILYTEAVIIAADDGSAFARSIWKIDTQSIRHYRRIARIHTQRTEHTYPCRNGKNWIYCQRGLLIDSHRMYYYHYYYNNHYHILLSTSYQTYYIINLFVYLKSVRALYAHRRQRQYQITSYCHCHSWRKRKFDWVSANVMRPKSNQIYLFIIFYSPLCSVVVSFTIHIIAVSLHHHRFPLRTHKKKQKFVSYFRHLEFNKFHENCCICYCAIAILDSPRLCFLVDSVASMAVAIAISGVDIVGVVVGPFRRIVSKKCSK